MQYRLAVLLGLAVAASCAQAGSLFDFARSESDPAKVRAPAAELVLPAFPKAENLVEFDAGPAARFRVFVDTASISVSGDEVRFTHIVRSEGGASNVSYDGLLCSEYQRAIYALGRADGTWSKSRNTDWHMINESGVGGYFGALDKEIFCAEGGRGGPSGSAAELIKALKAAPNLRH